MTLLGSSVVYEEEVSAADKSLMARRVGIVRGCAGCGLQCTCMLGIAVSEREVMA